MPCATGVSIDSGVLVHESEERGTQRDGAYSPLRRSANDATPHLLGHIHLRTHDDRTAPAFSTSCERACHELHS